MEQREITSPAVRGSRKVWLDRQEGATHGCLFLDAELYLERVRAPELVPGLTCAYLSYGEPSDRHIDFVCEDRFSRFLVDELLPWLDLDVPVILCGLSLSGLATAYAVASYPDRFAGALCQSPSAWWNDEWLVRHCPPGAKEQRFWVSVGDEEVAENVTHGALVQKTSQVDSCRRLAEVLETPLQVFSGGHDPVAWAKELPQALAWLKQGF